MASVNYTDETYKTGASMSYPIVMKSPYADWRSLLIRVQVKTAATVRIGSLVKVNAATTTKATAQYVEITGAISTDVAGIIPDVLENKRQLEIDNSGAAPTKALKFAADSYIWMLPLIPGFVLSVELVASQAITMGSPLHSANTGGVQLGITTANDDVLAIKGRSMASIKTGTGVQWIPMVVL